MKRLDQWEVLEKVRKLIQDEGYLYQMMVDHERVDSLVVDSRGKKFKITVEQIEDDQDEDPDGLIVTEVEDLTADEFEEYKRHCENNPSASYDTMEPNWEYELRAEAEERRIELLD